MNSFTLEFLYKFLFSRRAGALIKIISWLAIIGLGTGVASLILVLSVMNGFNKSIRARKFSAEPHLVINMSDKSKKDIKQHPGVLWLEQQKDIQFDISESQDVILRTSDGFVQGAIAQGISQETLSTMIKESRKRHHQSEKEEITLKPGQAVFGGALGDVMGLFEGDQLTVVTPESLLGSQDAIPVFERITVKNFIRTEIDEIDSQKIYYITGESLVRLRNSASLQRTVEIRLPDPENFYATKKKLESFNLKVESWQDRNSNLFYSLKLEKFVVGLLLGLSTLIASFSLVTVMTLLVTQKRKEIGLLMALGFTAGRLQKIFTRVGLALAGFGIVGGLSLGVGVSLFLGKYSEGFLPNVYEETNVPTEVQLSQVVIVLSLAVVFALVTTWVSVRKISHLQPVDALRG